MIRNVVYQGQKIGYIEYTVQHTLEGMSIYIDYLYLHEQFRGKGLFKHLFKTMINIGKRRRIHIFYLIPIDDRLYELYQRYGFVGEHGLMRLTV